MKKSSIIWLVVIVLVILLVGYFWWASSSSQSSVATNQTSTTPSASEATSTANSTTPHTTTNQSFTLNNSGGGVTVAYLSGSNGMTLYQYTKDTTNVSNCTGACATAWPPYTVSAATAAKLTADPGIAGKISTIKRANGTLQVTYRGLPLYFYSKDTKSGDTKGEALNGFTTVAP